MFALQCVRMQQITSPMRSQIRHKSYFSRGVNYLFKKNLLLTNSITSGAFLVIGDLVEQEYAYQTREYVHQTKTITERYDWARSARMFIVGTLLGPLHHYYYIYLDKVLPKPTLRNVGIKIFWDQAFASPATIVAFFYGMSLLERKSMQDSTKEIKHKFSTAYLGDWIFWPPVQFINFYYLPTEYRVLYINFATMIFNVFLSYMKHDYH